MQMRIVRRADGEHALFEGGREIGRLMPRSISFGGYRETEDALRAAEVAYAALRHSLAEGGRRRRTHPPGGATTGVTLGANGRLSADGEPVGRIVQHEDGALGIAFELWLPETIWHAVAIGMASRLYDALATARERASPRLTTTRRGATSTSK
jgi:hypothetical protein